MHVVRYQITLEEPVLAATVGSDPNTAVTLPYVPGAAVRGAVAGRYGSFATNPDVSRALFLDGTVRFLHAYPVREGRRMLPTPHAWHRPKRTADGLYVNRAYDLALAEPPDAQWRAVEEPFAAFSPGTAHVHTPERVLTVHTQRNRPYGRAIKPKDARSARSVPDDGALYQYESLAPQQTFEGYVLCEEEGQANEIAGLLGTDPLFLGRARTSRGKACITGPGGGVAVFEADGGETEATAFGHAGRPVWDDAGEEDAAEPGLVVTLLSETVVRNARGDLEATPAAFTAALAAALGLDVKALRLRRCFHTVRPAGGFNRTWGLPIPQAPALAMGSVFVFEPLGVEAEARRRVVEQGIGERRVEGFGRVAFDLHGRVFAREVERWAPDGKGSAPEAFSDVEAPLARRVLERHLRQQLDVQLARAANEEGRGVQGPSRSQLSRLRNQVLAALAEPPTDGVDRLLHYVAHLEKRPQTREQFKSARAYEQPLLAWIVNLVGGVRAEQSDPEHYPVFSGGRYLVVNHATLGPVRPLDTDADAPNSTHALAYEYTLRLIAAVLHRARLNARS